MEAAADLVIDATAGHDIEAVKQCGQHLGIGLAALGTGVGIGMLAAKSVEAAARQPEAGSTIQRMMILGIAFIEALCLYALLIAIMLSMQPLMGAMLRISDSRTLTVAENVALGLPGRRGLADMKPVKRRLAEVSEQYGLRIDPDAYAAADTAPGSS